MSQRSEQIDESMIINLKLEINIKSFSNHNGFKDGQIKQAIEEFKDCISKEIRNKIVNDYQMEEFLYSVDFVDFEVN